MTTLIEKAARAAFPDAYISSSFSGAENAKKWADAKAAVRAVLKTIRAPGDSAIEAAYARLERGGIANEWADDGACTVRAAHEAIIDSLLGEG